jgi:predicted GNAT family N-acyltransferase
MPVAGGCHCGRVRFAVTTEPLGTLVCRCTSCRRATGALRVPWTTVPTAAFAWTQGEPRERESSPGVLRTHCADCGTTLTWQRRDRSDETDVTTVSFDVAPEGPAFEVYGEDDPAWASGVDHGLPLYARGSREARLLPAPDGLAVQLVDFAAHRHALMAVRLAVFVEEQGVPREIEADDRDAGCLHVLVTDGVRPVATGRLDVERDGKIGRVAVVADGRGRGIGTLVMRQLHRLARGRGLDRVWCHAQRSAVPFYERLGYRAQGAEFDEAGIPHRTMRAQLSELAP